MTHLLSSTFTRSRQATEREQTGSSNMEIPLLSQRISAPFGSISQLSSLSTLPGKRLLHLRNQRLSVSCCASAIPPQFEAVDSSLNDNYEFDGRRQLMGFFLVAATAFSLSDMAGAVSTSRRALRGAKIPESEYTTLPNGLKYYDVKVGGGPKAVKGSRVAVHYVAKWKGITFMTSRQGLGVSGGTPYGFDVGQSVNGSVLKGLDLGVEGMRVGGQRLLIVPPELAYGSKGIQEIPPNATLELDVELLAIKQNPFGSAVKLVEG
ncbi:hypothetical protein AMTRI_Chr03g147210 [Amborella trichopoda]|nr:peptidyl-prolyl cis-trans isomerase FKBP16-4, chloroplastic isoform X2 [Amborella trichopoda]|eukprot:XP_006838763.2 peptidyl-prolyl cis-trans isomerase FKBP16-4, chloroplastic isoform X2 [Amborella trichopoda]